MNEYEDLSRTVEEALGRLASEYAGYMRELGKPTLPIMEGVGHVTTTTYIWDPGDTVHYHCKRSGREAWPFRHPPSGLHAKLFVVGTDGRFLFSESAAPMKEEQDGDYSFEGLTSAIAPNQHIPGISLVCGDPNSWGSASWAESRRQLQERGLTGLAQEAQARGVEAVMRPIELSMVQAINHTRQR